jgi:hypothetical protein
LINQLNFGKKQEICPMLGWSICGEKGD